MYCRNCGVQIPPQATICANCGVITGVGNKEKTTFVLLGALLGFMGLPGIHNFYIGETGKGLVQLLLSVLTCWILWIPMYIWTIVEICTVTHDAEGRPLR